MTPTDSNTSRIPECGSKEDTVIHCEAADVSNAITKSRARELTKEVAHSLRHNFGIGANGPGKDVVVCISSGQPLLPILFYGCIAAGGVYSAASASFTAPELSRQIKQGSSKLIFCSEDARDVACQAAKDCGVDLSRVLIIKSSPEWSMRSVVEGGEMALPSNGKMDWERITDPKTLEESLICLLYSSGTTGIPKGRSILLLRAMDSLTNSRCSAFTHQYCVRMLHSDCNVVGRHERAREKRRTPF
jgi:4-coumarate--CoA ligase